MQTIEFWNKETPINGVAASKVLANDIFLQNTDSIFLVKSGDIVQRIEATAVIRGNFPSETEGMSDQEVAEWYLGELQKPAVAEETPTSAAELNIMEGQTSIYEQNLQIIEMLNSK